MVSVARTSGPIWLLWAAGLCATLFAAAVGGAYSIRADSVNILAPYWLPVAVAILGVGLWAQRANVRLRSRGATAFLLAAFVVLSTILLAPLAASWASPSATPAGGPGAGFRIVSFNMYKANPDIRRVSDWLLRQNADVVVLLEAGPANRRALSRLLTRYPHVYDCSEGGQCSTLILSRLPAEEVWPLARGDADNRQTLSAVTARFRLGGVALPVTAVHMDRPWPLGDQKPHLQRLITAVAAQGRGGVVIGDFNNAPWTFALREMASASATRLATGALGTWPTDAPLSTFMLPLDQLYLGSCLAVRSVRAGPRLGSDHLPIVADISTGGCLA